MGQRSGRARPSNLPAELTSFVGRRSELREVKRLLGTTRLLTLTGSGGAGKTRLALRAVCRTAPWPRLQDPDRPLAGRADRISDGRTAATRRIEAGSGSNLGNLRIGTLL